MALTTKRCYRLGLPAEVRLTIYYFTFDDSPKDPGPLTWATLVRGVIGLKVEDPRQQVLTQSGLLRTSEEILLEAAPIYLQVVQVEVALLEKRLAEYVEAAKAAPRFTRQAYHDFYCKDVDDLLLTLADDPNNQTNMASRTQSCLLNLPAELRLEVYNHILSDLSLERKLSTPHTIEELRAFLKHYARHLKQSTAFLTISHQILQEALPICQTFPASQAEHLQHILLETVLEPDGMMQKLLTSDYTIDMDMKAKSRRLLKLLNAFQELLPKLKAEKRRLLKLECRMKYTRRSAETERMHGMVDGSWT